MARKPATDFETLSEYSATPFVEIADRMVAAVFLQNASTLEREEAELMELFTATLTLADLSGRSDLLSEADQVASEKGIDTDREDGRLLFSEGSTISPVVPETTFEEAIEDIVSRTPILQEEMQSGVPRYEEIQRLYRERHAFGLAKSFSDKLTERIFEIFKKAAQEGQPVKSTTEAIAKAGDFTRAYSETVYRTNLSTAYTAGRFKQLEDPIVQLVFGALEFVAVTDADTRDNHLAAHGLIAGIHDPVWTTLSPPLGYNCRCAVFPVDRLRLSEMNLIRHDGKIKKRPPRNLSAARADTINFGRRPDSAIYS